MRTQIRQPTESFRSGTYETDYQIIRQAFGDELDTWAVVTVRTLLPAPQIIELTDTVPEPVVAEIRRASALVRLDPQASRLGKCAGLCHAGVTDPVNQIAAVSISGSTVGFVRPTP